MVYIFLMVGTCGVPDGNVICKQRFVRKNSSEEATWKT
jgi:hypothetical protein